jgi:hypothetical protein
VSAATVCERGAIELVEEHTPADAGDLHWALIDRINPFTNRGVQIGEREERAVPQRRQDPALGDLDTDLDFRFVGRRGDAGGNDDRAIVTGEVRVRAVDLGFVAARRRDATLQIVRHPDRW